MSVDLALKNAVFEIQDLEDQVKALREENASLREDKEVLEGMLVETTTALKHKEETLSRALRLLCSGKNPKWPTELGVAALKAAIEQLEPPAPSGPDPVDAPREDEIPW